MTENEAIERIKYRMHTVEQVVGESGMEDLEMAVKALEKIQQYRADCTVEEYRETVRKIKSDKVLEKHGSEAQEDIIAKEGFPMKIELEIPKEFEIDYKFDKFDDFFNRVLIDMRNEGLCGEHEHKVAKMFIKSFKNSSIVSY